MSIDQVKFYKMMYIDFIYFMHDIMKEEFFCRLFVIPKCSITASNPTDITKNILFI